LALAITLLAGSVHAQDPLSAAKELYASAAYDEALAALDRLKAGASPALTIEIDQYRAFCLFALGRTAEAEAVAEGVIRANPLVDLRADETSPRIVALFTDLQKRMLPGLIRDRYRTARASMEEADTAATTTELELVQRMLTKAKSAGAWDEALADMSVLVEGFLDLSRSQAARRAAAVPPPAPAPAVSEPPPASATTASAAPLAPADGGPASRPANVPAAPTTVASSQPAPPEGLAAAARAAVYSALDTHVTGPVALLQAIPRVPANLALSMRTSKRTGVLEVTIDERGRVETAFIRESANPVFDGMVVSATKSWEYQPARLEGQPVRYLKRIAFTLQ